MLKLTPEEIVLKIPYILDPGYILDFAGRLNFCDDEICGKTFINLINEINSTIGCAWEKVDMININKMDTLGYKFLASIYKTENNVQLIAILAEYDDLPDDANFLILNSSEWVVIVGVEGAHPMVETSYITYVNSDGSGPIMFTSNEINNPGVLIQKLAKYYQEFIDDNHH